MSDIPAGYFLNGKELLDFRREPNIGFVLVGPKHRAPKHRLNGEKVKRKRQQLIERDGMDCHYCGVKMRLPIANGRAFRFQATIEHIVPRSKGGSSDLYNLVLACNQCNNKLGDSPDKCHCDFCLAAQVR